MEISEKLSIKLVKYVSRSIEKTEEEVEQIQYGIQVILINFFKAIILFSTAYFLHLFLYTFIAVISFALIRAFANGVHTDSSIKCIIINYILFLGNAYLSSNITISRITAAGIVAISLISYIIYAPADTEERPLISKKLRKESKIKAIVVVIALGAVSILFLSSTYRNLIIFSILEGAVIITPFVYWVFGKSYRNYEKVEL